MDKKGLRKKLGRRFHIRLQGKAARRLDRGVLSGEPTRRFGLLGHPLGHTLSPYIHRKIMESAGINGEYRAYDADPRDFDAAAARLLEDLDGFNVTIPYKQEIIPKLDSLDLHASRLGAVNTVCGGRGYNTDAIGFRLSCMPLKGRRVLLLGAGGTARVMLGEALAQRALSVGIHARRTEQAEELIRRYAGDFPETRLFVETAAGGEPDPDAPGEASAGLSPSHRSSPEPYDVILNSTPVGMWPHCGGIPVSRAVIAEAEYVFDAVYNPLASRLVLAARSLGVRAQSGLEMLLHQAAAAQKIWNPDHDFSDFSFMTLEQMLRRRLLKKFPVKIVLTGFMGSGKTTVGKALARSLGIGFADIDLMVVEENAKPVSAIFKEDGEEHFRKSEKNCIRKAMEMPRSLVVATGGGAVMDPENVGIIRGNGGFLFFLHTSADTIFRRIGDDGTRPLLGGRSRQKVEELYRQRMPLYYASADFTIEAEGGIPDIVEDIRSALGF